MTIRTVAGTGLVAAALLIAPAGASARSAEQVDRFAVPATPEVRADAPALPLSGNGHGGLGTLAVVAIAGGALVAGTAGGFGGRRVLTRGHILRP